MLIRLLGQMVLATLAVNMALAGLWLSPGVAASAGPVRIVALGDSLTAGYGLGPGEALPAVIERLLKAKGNNVQIQNAGVSGDTTSGGLARLDWAVPQGTDAVILALGANDMLRGAPVDRARANLEAILNRLRSRGIPVLVAGMLASRNLGNAYADAFDRIYPELARKHGALLYPFLLQGVAQDPKLNLPDGVHPNAEGVRRIASRILPSVEHLVARVNERRQQAATK